VRFSLVLATLGRTEEVAALMFSLAAQSWRDFEVIVVDQNGDDRLAPLIDNIESDMTIVHVRSAERRLSHARNVGLQRCSGEIVGFPDDDCIYPPNVLDHVARRFLAEPLLAMLSGPAASPSGGVGSARWEPRSGPITRATVWTSVISFNLFIRRELVLACGGFDEELGVGARFGSAEETDLALRLLRSGAKGFYDVDLRVVHPDKRLTPVAAARAFGYGSGTGRVLRKNRAQAATVLTFMARPLGGMALSAARLRWLEAQYYWRTLRGRAAGYLA